MGGGVGSRGVEVGVGVCCAGPPVAIRVRGQRHSLRCVGGAELRGMQGKDGGTLWEQQRLSRGPGSSDSAASVSFHPDQVISFMQESQTTPPWSLGPRP